MKGKKTAKDISEVETPISYKSDGSGDLGDDRGSQRKRKSVRSDNDSDTNHSAKHTRLAKRKSSENNNGVSNKGKGVQDTGNDTRKSRQKVGSAETCHKLEQAPDNEDLELVKEPSAQDKLQQRLKQRRKEARQKRTRKN